MEMRRRDRLMSNEDALNILKEGEYGILATVDSNGQPYGVPLSYIVIDNTIYYHGANAGGTKHNNIINNDKVTFTVVGKTKILPDKFGTLYESVIAFGKAALVTDEAESLMAFKEFLYKYCTDYIAEGEKYIDTAGSKAMIVKIAIDSLTGKHRV
ncbi:pyridoxamine 5'-phosphate oxidase family protein [Clostridium aminobutyricum]|uniref:Pyridoxamine 5'-phosphate oxidase family protein n=1 Tax=Clostridium aminobutyricum TaxID=33953 RepID=A0A939IJD2_CLOAM|nr:pyridoxamine 5'-phosphate oxidase family protein [Clostridium aminobutyricum]MBN7773488.1 pyridoxamine 5'-phosphate oxidase family protein [Clostridium aminobutyricum]